MKFADAVRRRSRQGHIDFWEQFPYDPDQAKAWAANNTINHDDKQVGASVDRMKEAGTEEAFLQAGHDFQQYVVENMPAATGTSLPLLQAARTSVKGYEHLHGFKIRFETTWLDEP